MPNTIPSNMSELIDIFANAARDAGATVSSMGHGYDNGPYEDMEVELPNGFRVYINLEESQDDEYLAERYPEEY